MTRHPRDLAPAEVVAAAKAARARKGLRPASGARPSASQASRALRAAKACAFREKCGCDEARCHLGLGPEASPRKVWLAYCQRCPLVAPFTVPALPAPARRPGP